MGMRAVCPAPLAFGRWATTYNHWQLWALHPPDHPHGVPVSQPPRHHIIAVPPLCTKSAILRVSAFLRLCVNILGDGKPLTPNDTNALAKEQGTGGDTQGYREQVNQWNGDQAEADQTEARAGRKTPPNDHQFGAKLQPAPLQRWIEKVEAGDGRAEHNTSRRGNNRTKTRHKVQ